MKIIGIDPGYGKCGWAVLAKGEQTKNEKLKTKSKKTHTTSYKLPIRQAQGRQATSCLIACDCIETQKRKNLPDRLKEIYDGVQYVIKKYQPQELAIEDLFWFKNQKTALAVAQARGVIITAAKNLGLEIFEYTPLQVKQAVVGYGRADKNQIQALIKIHLGGQEVPKQDDTADAVAVGLTHLQTNKILNSKS